MDAEIIVVGAGPAGSTVARLCALAGLDTLVIEKSRFPREKPCAGGLSPRAVADLARVFGPSPEAFGAPRSALRAHFLLAGPGGDVRSPAEGTTGWRRYRRLRVEARQALMWVTRRAVLDDYLLRRAAAAGARVLTGLEVVSWGQNPASVWVVARRTREAEPPPPPASAPGPAAAPPPPPASAPGPAGPPPPLPPPALIRTLSARFLVGADGAASVVARGLQGRSRRCGPTGRCLACFIPLEGPAAAEATRGALDFHFGLVRGGYGWVFPAPDGLAVGVGLLLGRPRRPRYGGDPVSGELDRALGRLLALYGFTPGESPAGAPRSWLLPLGGCRRLWGAGRVIVCGDAAGVADPLTGEGIGLAVRSAELAARAAVARVLSERRGAGRPGGREPGLGGAEDRAVAALGLPGARGGPPAAALERPGTGGDPPAAALERPGTGGDPSAGYLASLWRGHASRQRLRLWVLRGVSRLPAGGQGLLFRRATFRWLVREMVAGAPVREESRGGGGRPPLGPGEREA
ncbi:MAG: FAD-dependent monooxygenase [Bacillota bacterium]